MNTFIKIIIATLAFRFFQLTATIHSSLWLLLTTETGREFVHIVSKVTSPPLSEITFKLVSYAQLNLPVLPYMEWINSGFAMTLDYFLD
jgi:hypothetical protein